jgi:hypothetical protein
VTDPGGVAGLVLVAPAVLAFPGAEYADVKLSPDRPPEPSPLRPGGSRSGSGPLASPSLSPSPSGTAGLPPADRLGGSPGPSDRPLPLPRPELHYPESEPLGSHPTDPPEVRRLYPQGFKKAAAAGGEDAGGAGGLQRQGSGRRRGGPLRAVGAALGALAAAAVLVALRLLTPIITLLLRALVRQRSFWVKVRAGGGWGGA